jgi:hypothetical protein
VLCLELDRFKEVNELFGMLLVMRMILEDPHEEACLRRICQSV